MSRTPCDNCLVKADKLHTYYPDIMVMGVRDIEAGIKAKKKVCVKCLGKLQGPRTMVSFDAVHALLNWNFVKNTDTFPYLNEAKIYAFKDRQPDTFWAYAVVTNGDWFDIKEPHVRESIRCQDYPIKIDEAKLHELAKIVLDKNIDRPYPYGYAWSDDYPAESKRYKSMIDEVKKILGEPNDPSKI